MPCFLFPNLESLLGLPNLKGLNLGVGIFYRKVDLTISVLLSEALKGQKRSTAKNKGKEKYLVDMGLRQGRRR